MTVARIIRHPNGPRLYVGGLRVHHGTTGLLVAAAGLGSRSRPLVALGLLLAAHDRHDTALWLRVERFPADPMVSAA